MCDDLKQNLIEGRHKGSTILGAKDTCVVVSDVTEPGDGKSGIQHFYFRTFEHDYINGGYPVLCVNGNAEFAHKTKNKTNINPSFAAYVKYKAISNPRLFHEYRSFVAENGSLVVHNTITNRGNTSEEITISPFFRLTEDITSLQYDKKTDSVVAAGMGNIYIIIAMKEREFDREAIRFSSDRETWSGKINVLLQRCRRIPARSKISIEYYVIPANNIKEGLQELEKLRGMEDLLSSTQTYWNKWLDKGLNPKFPSGKFQSYYEANLLSLKAINLGGAIPGDLTGQFVANKSSMFAPRDSMMTARAFILAGHIEEALKILDYWTNAPLHNDGFFYAWYADVGRIEEKGTGAPHDNPQYDSNAYYTHLVLELFERTGEWYGNYELVLKLLDFLCEHQTEDGLLEPEGGVIEVMGILPGTNMSCAAGLDHGAVMCILKGDYKRAERYSIAAQKMRKGLSKLFDKTCHCYMDVRNPNWVERHTFTNGRYIWDTSLLLSVLLDFENTPEITSSNKWYLKNCEKLDGGMQYTREYKGHTYAEDLFLIFTGTSAQYQALYGRSEDYERQINWMMTHSNVYGLMPERILMPDGKEACKASPLSWSCAEFVSALLMGCFCAELLMGKKCLAANLTFVKAQLKAIGYYLREVHKGNVSPEFEVIERVVRDILERFESEEITGDLYLQLKEEVRKIGKEISLLELNKIIKGRLKKKADYAFFFLEKGLKLLNEEG